MSIDGRNTFNPTRVIVLSELSTREKEKYYQALLANKAKFHRDANGRYVASIRLLAPGTKKETEIKKVLGSGKESLPLEDRLHRLQQEFVSVRISGVEEFDYTPYHRFSLLIATNGEVVKPRPQSLFWLMKRIEALYDARFVHEKMDVERDDVSLGENANLTSIFPVFVVRRLSTEKGLIKTIVDQNCWDLLYNVHVYRHDYLEVEIFARFLQEFYDNDDLLFYLYVRSVIGKVLNVSFKSRWGKAEGPARQPKGLWMSFRECVQVARIVFGVTNETMWKRFLDIISPQMVGQKTDTVDSRRIDITQFLHLAVVGYHQTVPPGSGGASISSDNRSRSSSIGSAVMRNVQPSAMGFDNTNNDLDDYGMRPSQQNPSFGNNQLADDDYFVTDTPNEMVMPNAGWQQSLYASTLPPAPDSQYEELVGNVDEGQGGYSEQDDLPADYGSSLDAYLAALSADGPVPIGNLLLGSPKKVDVLPQVPPLQFQANSRVNDFDDFAQFQPGSNQSSGRLANPGRPRESPLPQTNKPGVVVVSDRGSGNSTPTAFLSISAPILPTKPRIEKSSADEASPLPSSATDQNNSFIDETGQWQENEDSVHDNSFSNANMIASSPPEVASSDAVNDTDLGETSQVSFLPSATYISDGELSDGGKRDSKRYRSIKEAKEQGLLHSYQSGYSFSLEDLDAMAHGATPEVMMNEVDKQHAAAHSHDNEGAGIGQTGSMVLNDIDTDFPATVPDDGLTSEEPSPRGGIAARSYPPFQVAEESNPNQTSDFAEPDHLGNGETSATAEPEMDNDEFASLQLDREREFLSFVCAPLAELPESVAESIVDELANNLRERLNRELEGRAVSDLDSFDNILLDILQSDTLRIEMESMRDSMLHYLYEQVNQLQETGDQTEDQS